MVCILIKSSTNVDFQSADLHKHIVADEEEIEDLRGDEKRLKATRGLIDTHALDHATVLKRSCKRSGAS